MVTVLACGLLAALVYAILSVYAVARFPLGRGGRAGSAVPTVSVLKPVRGFNPLQARGGENSQDLRRDLASNLGSFFVQSYGGEFEILFGFQEPDDPAIALVEELCARHPHVRARVIRVPGARGPNRKASVLAALAKEAGGELLVVSDQDMRVDDRYLRAVVDSFASEAVGAVTCPYRTRLAYDVGGIFEALTINVDFIPSMLVARMLDRGLSFTLGATMAIRRTVLQAIGGFERLEPYLADDYLLGNRTLHAGWCVELCPYVVENVVPPTTLRQYFAHHLRWNRGYRVCRPMGYFFSVLMNGTFFATALRLVLGAAGFKLWAAWMGFRLMAASYLFKRVAGTRPPIGWLLLVPVRDAVSLVLWAMALSGNTVEWSGRSFLLSPDGKLGVADGK